VDVQKDPMRFRRNLVRIGEIMAFELSKTLAYENRNIKTPLGIHESSFIKDKLVIGTILRAGLPLHEGFLNYFDFAENAFVSAYRKYVDKENFDIEIEYISSPDLNGKTLILVDPMLATGTSFELAYRALLTKGRPSTIHFVSVIASKDGVAYLDRKLELVNIHLWCAAIDPELDKKSYIVPGLGDAGDLAFGEKT
jgi:uracil phosphoribosyltransferase